MKIERYELREVGNVIDYLVDAGERQDDDADHEIGDSERDDELVGGRRAQLAVREDGRDDHHVTDDDEQIDGDQSQHRQNELERRQLRGGRITF